MSSTSPRKRTAVWTRGFASSTTGRERIQEFSRGAGCLSSRSAAGSQHLGHAIGRSPAIDTLSPHIKFVLADDWREDSLRTVPADSCVQTAEEKDRQSRQESQQPFHQHLGSYFS